MPKYSNHNMENYLNGNLSEVETKLYTQQILTEGFDEIYRSKWKQTLSEEYGMPTSNAEFSKKNKRQLRVRFLAIAASILFLCVAGPFSYQLMQASQEVLLAEYLSEKMPCLNTTKGGGKAINKQQITASQAYKDGQYAVAISAYQALMTEGEDTIFDRFFFGLSYLYNDQPKQAILILEEVRQSSDTLFEEELPWFLSLAYLKAGAMGTAKKSLEAIGEREWKYEEAQLLLSSMK